jgi:hypothetical protein
MALPVQEPQSSETSARRGRTCPAQPARGVRRRAAASSPRPDRHAGLTIGLYMAVVLRALVRDPKPILWNLLWNQGLIGCRSWCFCSCSSSGATVHGPRELREGAGKVVSSVVLVTALALAFAIGTDQHSDLRAYIVAAITVSFTISCSGGATRRSRSALRSLGVRRRVPRGGETRLGIRVRPRLGPQRHRLRVRGHAAAGPAVMTALADTDLDGSSSPTTTSRVAAARDRQAAHREGVKVMIAPRTTEPRRAWRGPRPGGAAQVRAPIWPAPTGWSSGSSTSWSPRS